MHSTGIPVDVEQLRQQPLFQHLDLSTLTRIATGGWTVEAHRAVRILGRGDHLHGLYTVLEGRLKLYMLSCNGDERVLRVLQPGDSFGEAIMFNAIPSPVFVEAMSAVRLGYFPREVITDALVSSPDFMVSMLRGMSAMMRELIHDLETCCLQSATQRTVGYLLRESEGCPAPGLEIRLPAPKAVVASTLNISAETFSRELHRLQEEGFIQIDRRIIRVRDRAALVALVDGATIKPDFS